MPTEYRLNGFQRRCVWIIQGPADVFQRGGFRFKSQMQQHSFGEAFAELFQSAGMQGCGYGYGITGYNAVQRTPDNSAVVKLFNGQRDAFPQKVVFQR